MTRQTIPTAELRVLAHKTRTQHAFETYVLDANGMRAVAWHDRPDGELIVVADEHGARGTILWRNDGNRH